MTNVENDLRAGLGALVWMSLRNVEMPRADLRAVFAGHGLGRAVPRDPTVSATLSRATREALVGVSGEWAFDRVRDDATACTAVLSQRVTDASAETVRYDQRGLVRVIKATGVVDSTLNVFGNLDADAILARCVRMFTRARDFATTEDLRAAMHNALHGRRRDPLLGAINVDGVSFVLNDKRATVEALAAWVREHEFGKVTVLGIADDQGTRTEVATGARDTIAKRVGEIVRDAESLAEKVRAASEEALDGLLEPYLERFALAEAQAAVYEGVLGSMSEELTRTIKAAREAFAARVL